LTRPRHIGRWSLAVILGAGLVLAASGVTGAQSRVSLERVRSFHLAKVAGGIDQAIPYQGGFLVRDSEGPSDQAIEKYDSKGTRTGKIGSAGMGPGQYHALQAVATSRNGEIWAADVYRLSIFDARGTVVATRLVQKPGFLIRGLALDEAHGRYYLTGCAAAHSTLDEGCHLLHVYQWPGGAYVESLWDTDPEAVAKRLFPWETYQVDVAADGRVYTVDSAIPKLIRVDVAGRKVSSFPIASHGFTPLAPPEAVRDLATTHAVGLRASKIERLVVSGDAVVLSIRPPATSGTERVLEVLTLDGAQIATDLASPGRLVGTTSDGLLFANPVAGGFELTEYRIVPLAVRRP